MQATPSAFHLLEILVVDEVLAVGDAIFANRCVRKFQELKERGVTVVLVSHDLGLVKLLSDRAVLLYQGRALAEGDPSDVINRYNALVLDRQQSFLAQQAVPSTLDDPRDGADEAGAEFSFRHGDGRAQVVRVELLNQQGRPTRVVRSGEPARVRVLARFAEPHAAPVVGMMIRTRIGMEVFGTNTLLEEVPFGPARAGELWEVNFDFPCWLAPQEYTLTVATQSPDGSSHDWLDDALAFQVVADRYTAGVANLHARVTARRRQP